MIVAEDEPGFFGHFGAVDAMYICMCVIDPLIARLDSGFDPALRQRQCLIGPLTGVDLIRMGIKARDRGSLAVT